MVFYFFVFLVFWGATSEIAVLPAWELNSGELDRHSFVFLRFLGMLKSQVFTCLSFWWFFIIFNHFLEALGSLLASFWSFCRLFWCAGVILLGAFASPGLSVGSLC